MAHSLPPDCSSDTASDFMDIPPSTLMDDDAQSETLSRIEMDTGLSLSMSGERASGSGAVLLLSGGGTGGGTGGGAGRADATLPSSSSLLMGNGVGGSSLHASHYFPGHTPGRHPRTVHDPHSSPSAFSPHPTHSTHEQEEIQQWLVGSSTLNHPTGGGSSTSSTSSHRNPLKQGRSQPSATSTQWTHHQPLQDHSESLNTHEQQESLDLEWETMQEVLGTTTTSSHRRSFLRTTSHHPNTHINHTTTQMNHHPPLLHDCIPLEPRDDFVLEE